MNGEVAGEGGFAETEPLTETSSEIISGTRAQFYEKKRTTTPE